MLEECLIKHTKTDLMLDQCTTRLGEVIEKDLILIEECRVELEMHTKAQNFCEIYQMQQQKREKE